MNLALTVLNITAPIFILAAVGYGWVKLGFEYRVEFVTRLAMTLSVPCLIFVALMTADIDPQALGSLSLASFTAYGLVSIVFLGIVKLRKLDTSTYLAPLVFGNTGNLGLPLAMFAFGEEGLSYAVVVFAVMAILSFTIGVWVVAGGGSPIRVIKEPVVAATFLGALFLWQGWQTPIFLTNALELIGQMAIPIMLITLGVAIARLETNNMGRAVWLSAIKVVVSAGAAWTAARWFGLAPIPSAVLIVQLATPVAVTSYLLAKKYGHEAQPVAGLVVASTLLCVISLPLILAFVI
ncbi:MAG: AEC family transporter [Rhodobacterales bacterium]